VAKSGQPLTVLSVTSRCISNINNQKSAVPDRATRCAWQRRMPHHDTIDQDHMLPGIRNSSPLVASTPQHLNAKLRARLETWSSIFKSVAANVLFRFFLLLIVSLAVAPAPAGTESRGCVGVSILDPDIKASFARFDQTQSPHAARLCSVFFNNAALQGALP
jgi:hypothetical protein